MIQYLGLELRPAEQLKLEKCFFTYLLEKLYGIGCYTVDGVDPGQNIGFENKGNIGDIGILGGNIGDIGIFEGNKNIFKIGVFLISE